MREVVVCRRGATVDVQHATELMNQRIHGSGGLSAV
jgi:hypothetical protein